MLSQFPALLLMFNCKLKAIRNLMIETNITFNRALYTEIITLTFSQVNLSYLP